jgi:hypothetical protein
MTSTQVISSQSVGTGANKGEELFAIRLTPNAITDRFFVEAVLTNGATDIDTSDRPQIRYACYNASITAALAPPILRRTARYLEVIPSPNAGLVVSRTSLLEPLSGPYIYLWVDMPAFPVAGTLSVWIHEGP